MENHLHDKHRERMRQELRQGGFRESTPDHKLLEFLLFYVNPRGDTNDTAHLLLNRFGSLRGVLKATRDQLIQVEGIGPKAVDFFDILHMIMRRYEAERIKEKEAVISLKNVGQYLSEQYTGRNKETFSVVTFQSNGEMIAFDIISEGTLSEVAVSNRVVLETVLKRNAFCALIAHNHPGGTAVPSPEDIEMTFAIAHALAEIRVPLIDHMVFAEDDYVSMRQSRQFAHMFSGKTLKE